MADGTTRQQSFCGIFSADEVRFCDEMRKLCGRMRRRGFDHGRIVPPLNSTIRQRKRRLAVSEGSCQPDYNERIQATLEGDV